MNINSLINNDYDIYIPLPSFKDVCRQSSKPLWIKTTPSKLPPLLDKVPPVHFPHRPMKRYFIAKRRINAPFNGSSSTSHSKNVSDMRITNWNLQSAGPANQHSFPERSFNIVKVHENESKDDHKCNQLSSPSASQIPKKVSHFDGSKTYLPSQESLDVKYQQPSSPSKSAIHRHDVTAAPKSSADFDVFLSAIEKFHKETVPVSSKNKMFVSDLKCQYCDRKFIKNEHKIWHEVNHLERQRKRFFCSAIGCTKRFSRFYNLKCHMETDHSKMMVFYHHTTK